MRTLRTFVRILDRRTVIVTALAGELRTLLGGTAQDAS